MRRALAAGIAAGAVGTVALNIATYLDMLIRSRSPSTLPADAAETLADMVGVDLGDEETAPNRREALGALLGIATGLSVGAVFGLVQRRARMPTALAAVGLGAAAMAGSDVPMTALGLTDPREWDGASWVADALPHLAYGAAAAATYKLLG